MLTENDKKFKLLTSRGHTRIIEDIFHNFKKVKVYQVKALVSIPRHGIMAGDTGGWVQSEDNLSRYGDAWIDKGAIVFGNAKVIDNALVSGKDTIIGGNTIIAGNSTVSMATIEGNVRISNNAKVTGAYLSDNAWVKGNAVVSGKNINICNDALVLDNAKVYDYADVRGKACIHGNAMIGNGAYICGRAMIYGDAMIFGSVSVSGDSKIYGNAVITGNMDLHGIADIGNNHQIITFKDIDNLGVSVDKNFNDTLTFFMRKGSKGKSVGVSIRKFYGTINDFERAVNSLYGDDKYGRFYRSAINFARNNLVKDDLSVDIDELLSEFDG